MKPALFVILFMGRSGSTLLASLLGSHPQLFCRLEEFSLENSPDFDATGDRSRVLLGWRGEPMLREPTSEQCLQRLDLILRQPFHSVGFKFKFPVQVNAYPEIMERLRAQADDLRVIRLRRMNQLKRAISRQNLVSVLKSPQKDQLRGANASVDVEFRKIKIDLEQLASFLKRQARQEAWLDELVSTFPNRIEVAYEEMLDRQSETLCPVLEFLGVDSTIELAAKVQKLAPHSLRDIVENFDELEAAYRGTEFAPFLDR